MASERYNAPVREKHWQQVWNEKGTFRTKDKSKKPKRYQLEMFPYPSGRIHMGHVRCYTLGDVMARYMRAKGYNVLHPMGWDAFGLPAENAAMERKVHPRKWTYENIDTMRGQLKAMGLSIDWEREFATCNPDYYVHQQRLFLDFLKKKLAYRKTAKVNWDPVENTVLANEQVIDGRGWRSGAVVEQRDLTQWFFKITAFAEELLQALDGLEATWPDFVCTQQRNWIGKSTGANMQFALEGGKLPRSCSTLEVFTTRHDTIFGASFMAISPEHPLRPPGEEEQGAGRVRRGVPQDRYHRGSSGEGGEEGFRHRHCRGPSLQAGRQAAGVRRQLHRHGLRHRRHLRLPGARSARSRFRPQIWASRDAGGAAAWRKCGDVRDCRRGLYRRRHDNQFRVPRRAPHRGGQGQDGRPARRARHRRAQGELPHARLAAVAPALLGLSDSGHPLREGRHRAGPGRPATGAAAGGRHLRQAGQPARSSSDVEAREVSQVRRRCRARDRHHGHVRRQLLVPVPLHRAHTRRRRPTRRPSSTGRRSTSTSAARSTRCCTCCTRASSRAA